MGYIAKSKVPNFISIYQEKRGNLANATYVMLHINHVNPSKYQDEICQELVLIEQVTVIHALTFFYLIRSVNYIYKKNCPKTLIASIGTADGQK